MLVPGTQQALHDLTQRITKSGVGRDSLFCNKEDFAVLAELLIVTHFCITLHPSKAVVTGSRWPWPLTNLQALTLFYLSLISIK